MCLFPLTPSGFELQKREKLDSRKEEKLTIGLIEKDNTIYKSYPYVIAGQRKAKAHLSG